MGREGLLNNGGIPPRASRGIQSYQAKKVDFDKLTLVRYLITG